MRYAVMYRGRIQLRTNDIKAARAKMDEIGDTAYIQYASRGIAEYERTHGRHVGEEE
ncbi:MAG: hypothetical protein QNJ81_02120 [Acidimicrobiia bacterium]|nr:hypothetical protein [Acidimicrobiia bacterium]